MYFRRWTPLVMGLLAAAALVAPAAHPAKAQTPETGRYVFDPEHFHGPFLTAITSPVVRLRGESSWDELTTHNLRLGVALFDG